MGRQHDGCQKGAISDRRLSDGHQGDGLPETVACYGDCPKYSPPIW